MIVQNTGFLGKDAKPLLTGSASANGLCRVTAGRELSDKTGDLLDGSAISSSFWAASLLCPASSDCISLSSSAAAFSPSISPSSSSEGRLGIGDVLLEASVGDPTPEPGTQFSSAGLRCCIEASLASMAAICAAVLWPHEHGYWVYDNLYAYDWGLRWLFNNDRVVVLGGSALRPLVGNMELSGGAWRQSALFMSLKGCRLTELA